MLLLWICITIGAIVIEIFTLGNLICIWFAIGGAVSALLAYLNMSDLLQYIAFFVASIASMLVIRPLAENYLRGNTVPTNSDRLINQTCTLLSDITEDNWGEIKIGGTRWSAVSYNNQPISAHTTVKIIAIDGAKLVVKELDQ